MSAKWEEMFGVKEEVVVEEVKVKKPRKKATAKKAATKKAVNEKKTITKKIPGASKITGKKPAKRKPKGSR